MKIVQRAEDVINSTYIPPGSVLYASGNAAPPQKLLKQLADDLSIKDIEMYSVLLLGEDIRSLFSEERCQTLTHRVIFNGRLSQEAVGVEESELERQRILIPAGDLFAGLAEGQRQGEL